LFSTTTTNTLTTMDLDKATQEPQTATEAASPATAPVVADEFWSGTKIAAIADGVTAKIGAEQNLMARTLFVALDGARFLPVRVYPCLTIARRAVAGMGMMMVASLAPIEGSISISYDFSIGRLATASGLAEAWSVRVGDSVLTRFLLVPTETIVADLTREDATVAAYTIKPKGE
jgi:hypothetical protein